MAQIVERKTEFATPWFKLISKRVAGENAAYYALQMLDYVSVVAFTDQQELVLVRQFRPAVERETLELPAGHVEKGETPEHSARRELAEECGFDAPKLELLGSLISDTGRNENRVWCFLAPRITPVGPTFVPEPGVERVLVPRKDLPQLLAGGEFNHALHVAALMLAVLKRGPDVLALGRNHQV
jgi:ADP-ribose pyrophosphatase